MKLVTGIQQFVMVFPRRLPSIVSLLLIAGLFGGLSGCATPPAPEPLPPAPAPLEPAKPTKEEIRQRAIAHFLQRAEAAQREGFYTMPAGASAYDFYLNVLNMDPGNQRARTGIQIIVMELVGRARDALRQRAFGQVNSLLNRADEISPGNPLSAEVRQQLRREQRRAAAAVSDDGPAAQSVNLPPAELSAKSPKMVEVLQSIAQQIRAHQLRVIIVARNDAEGRWIYGQLREAVPGYRVRGDIRLGSPPRLLLQKSQ
ncbi:N-acetylglucosaminyltransferase [uncultured Microbulbifer sp.]|uniref:N-acetylglucosaminyltransferase n=1 Tax=uncultured Microbulbifer sp. TaxID=348147 RepID=UPI0025EF222D|nr:N-acetylglucosaminyltransferase [uncultured Microbulbifer sp.]